MIITQTVMHQIKLPKTPQMPIPLLPNGRNPFQLTRFTTPRNATWWLFVPFFAFLFLVENGLMLTRYRGLKQIWTLQQGAG
jgi:hypothetical protein